MTTSNRHEISFRIIKMHVNQLPSFSNRVQACNCPILPAPNIQNPTICYPPIDNRQTIVLTVLRCILPCESSNSTYRKTRCNSREFFELPCVTVLPIYSSTVNPFMSWTMSPLIGLASHVTSPYVTVPSPIQPSL